ncbi:MAG: alanyl-tRNA editing protein [Ktedonobacterales bacterium]|nr:alanyl-tRNA editing protein [Ktedonobacterales bacterium]
MEATPTLLLYHNDSYLHTFTARIIATEGHALALDRTAFYPGGGGQLADRGALLWEGRRLPLTSLRKAGDVVWHTLALEAGALEAGALEAGALEAGALPPVGAEVTGEVDWPFRYRMMRTHTALHLLCGIIFRDYGAQVTGGQMYPDRARMDFALEMFSSEFTRDIEARVNDAVAADAPIKIYTLPRAQALEIPDLIRTKVNLLPPDIMTIRIVEIVGLDLQADGGTHVRSTREVGGITVLKTENKGKLNKRMEITLADTPAETNEAHT